MPYLQVFYRLVQVSTYRHIPLNVGPVVVIMVVNFRPVARHMILRPQLKRTATGTLCTAGITSVARSSRGSYSYTLGRLKIASWSMPNSA